MAEWDPKKPTLEALVNWGIIKLRIVDDNEWPIDRDFTLHVIQRKGDLIYVLPEFIEES